MRKIKNTIVVYNFLICFTLTVAGAVTAKTVPQLINSLIYLPLSFYFALLILWKLRTLPIADDPRRQAEGRADSPAKRDVPTQLIKPIKDITDVSEVKGVPDVDRRVFLRLIGSAGIAMFMMALFTKRAEAAFFGSVPGPGTIALKDSAGNKIDPAEKQPTDGYKIAQLDDTSSATYAYYGFINKSGAWYIQRETLTGGTAGQYLYSSGSSSFSTNWTNRAALTYDYFDVIF